MKHIFLLFILLTTVCISNGFSCNIIIENEYPSINSPRCGANNGSIEIVAKGRGKVKYSLNKSAYQESGFFSGLGAGQYVITMTDDSGCKKSFTTTLESLTGVSIDDIKTQNSECDKNTGSITVSATGEGLKYKLNNGPLQTSNTFTGLKGGKYTVVVVDALKCQEVKNVTISQGSITVNGISKKSASCVSKNGSITVNAVSKNKIQYKLLGISKWQNKNQFEKLAPGKYTLSIRESTGCELKYNNITIPNEYRVGFKIKNPTCGEKNGNAQVTTSPKAIYKYSIDNGATWNNTGLFENLPKGGYTVLVQGVDNECSSKSNFTLQEEKTKIPDLKIENNPVSCSKSDGKITVLTAMPNLTYKLFFQNKLLTENKTGTFADLKDGKYRIKVYTANNCESEWYDTTIGISNDIELETPQLDSPNCNSSTGRITLNAKSNKNLQLTYSIDGTNFSNNPVFENLETGNYRFIIKSESNCSKVVDIFLPENNTIGFTKLNTEPPTTDCSKDGQIVAFTNSDDTKFSLDNITYQESNTFNNLGSGKYTVYIKNSVGCIRKSGVINFVGLITIDEIQLKDDKCNYKQGSATIYAKGKNLTFSLDGKNFQKENTFTDLPKGNYTAYVSDGSTCVVNKEFIIKNQGQAVIQNVTTETTSCGLANGKATISYLDEGIGYQFKLNDGAFQNEPTFTNLASGTYTATIKGSDNCENSFEFEVPQSFPIEANINKTLVCNSPSAVFEVIATGGVGQLQYSIDNKAFSTNAKFSDLALGNHTIQIKDEVGCVLKGSIQVGKTEIESVKVTPKSCQNSNPTFEVKYTDFGGKYQFKLDDSSFQDSPIFNSVKSGNYIITIRDEFGCESNTEATMPETFSLSSNIEENLTFCTKSATYPFQITATGGLGKLEFSHNDSEFSSKANYDLPNGIHRFKIRDEAGCIIEGEVKVGRTEIKTVEVTPKSCKNSNPTFEVKYTDFGGQYQFKLNDSSFQDSPIFNSVKSGNYTITIRDEFGCESNTEAIMPETFPLSSNIQEQLVFCSETKTYPFELKAEGGVGKLEFSHNDSEFSSKRNYDLPTGIHRFKIRDEAGCTLEGEVKVGHAKIDDLVVKTTSCGLNNGEVTVSIEDFGDDYSFSLNNAPFTKEKEFKNLVPGDYTITVQGLFNCKDSRSFTIYESYPITHTMDDLYEWCSFQDGEIIVNAQGGVGTLRYALNNGDYSNNNRFTNVPDGTNTIYIIDDVGCTVEHTLTIGTDCIASFPSAITPNGNGKNDSFKLLYYKPLLIEELSVYDRWGNLVHKAANFESTDASQWWQPSPSDTISSSYAVYVEYKLDGETKFYKGLVQVIY